eukprot:CAMPEP_0194323104 /NCGR_PEP_ID=MMETSP0171-20130528/23982_1 /TAXON_ID=218684 /ORGANISM="Corethron pennatum, Strain L29A3" /LENGTH=464 /DNA_ID=CAMNT_0039081611 /DNA_START=133 /DNA_END=1527 /DNA_ORIENTATION=+
MSQQVSQELANPVNATMVGVRSRSETGRGVRQRMGVFGSVRRLLVASRNVLGRLELGRGVRKRAGAPGSFRQCSAAAREVGSTPFSTGAGRTFVATRNKNALKATDVSLHGANADIRPLMQSNACFVEAFEPQDERDAQKPQDPKPVIIQSSGMGAECVLKSPYGLVSAVQTAYNTHHDLVLRADDFWQAIVAQFSFYVNGNAEALRDKFVDFKGKQKLTIYSLGTLFTADFGQIAERMVDEQIVNNIKNPEVAAWLLPAFSTTTGADRVAASVMVMSALQAYFSFGCCLCCGLPSVTLLGVREDWVKLRSKIDGLLDFNLPAGHMAEWHKLLAPIADQLIASFDGKPDLDFWDTVCSHHGGGSGPSYLSGWITAFAVFSANGYWQGNTEDAGSVVSYPMIETSNIPVGVVSVPLHVDDNGTPYDTTMFAGQFVFDVAKNGKGVQPRTDWCIAFDQANPTKPSE